MRYTVRFKLFTVMSGLIILFIFLSWFFNDQLLEKYYFLNKKNTLIKSYQTINSMYRGDISQIELELEKIESDKALHVSLIGKDFKIKYDSWIKNRDIRLKPPEGQRRRRRPPLAFMKSLAQRVQQKKLVVKVVNDARLNADFIFMGGLLKNGDYLLLSTSIAAIRESVAIANRFFILTGFFTILVGGLLVYVLSGKFIKPILDLKAIAHKMAGLDFSQKYTGTELDELGELGQSINSLSEQLEKSISDLTTANQKLQADIERERKIDEMRKSFISNVSHELKTPIALIQGYAEGLKVNVNDDPENRNFYCDVIMDEAGKMNGLVKQLLDLAKLESGNLPLERECFDVEALLQQVLKRNQLLFQEKGVRLETAIAPELKVNADIDLIEQVINNYLSNALNHVAGDKLIRVSVQPVGDKARLTVFNSGLPIPDDSIAKIWTSFYKVDKARTREYGGTGLGLSIVRAIQEAHGSACGVNNLADGVEFWADLDRTGLNNTKRS
ncbi:MAG TPA: HAMP domain-containing sensor histidine kinase [Bacillota bacterium]|nr:HAMP domain-containing sensor histidine kinase [Bacillota bacterium]